MKKKVSLGIDLGTTNTVVTAKIIDEPPVTLTTESGSRLIPSIVHLSKDQIHVGENAQEYLKADPENTFYSTKRFIGRTSSEIEEISVSEMELYNYSLVVNENSVLLNCPNLGKQKPIQFISSFILKECLSIYYESFPHEKYELVQVCITIPAYFNASQRAATIDAALIAGIKNVEIINEPTAAALAYGEIDGEQSNTLIFDLGGGTFDISLVNYDGDGFWDVIASSGNNMLGGDDFDYVLSNLIKEKCFEINPNVKFSSEANKALKEFAKSYKKKLSFKREILLDVSSIARLGNNPFIKKIKITRKEFENASSVLVKKMQGLIKSFLELKEVKNESLDNVVLVGGSSRIPLFKDMVSKLTSKKIAKNVSRVNPDEIVSYGASLCAEYSHKGLVNFSDVTPLDLSIEDVFGKNNILIKANTKIPCKNTEFFTTAYDFQEDVSFPIRQGNRELASKTLKLGEFSLKGIVKQPKNKPQMEVSIEIDSNGMLKAYGLERVSNSQNQIIINNYQQLSKDQINKLREEAEKYLDEDKKIIYKNVFIDELFEKVENSKIYLMQKGADEELIEELSKYESQISREKDIKDLNLIDWKVQYINRNEKLPIYQIIEKDCEDIPELKDPFLK